MYLNNEKHPIMYFRYAIRQSTYSQKMVALIIVYILYRKLSSRILLAHF